MNSIRIIILCTLYTLCLALIGCEIPTTGAPSEEPLGDSLHSLRVVDPNGGESIKRTDTLFVTVRADTSRYHYRVIIRLSLDNGLQWYQLSEDESIPLGGQDTTLAYILPDSMYYSVYNESTAAYSRIGQSVVSSLCRIQVADYEHAINNYRDESDAVFAIVD